MDTKVKGSKMQFGRQNYSAKPNIDSRKLKITKVVCFLLSSRGITGVCVIILKLIGLLASS